LVKNVIFRLRNVIGVLVLLVSPLTPISPFLSKASTATPAREPITYTVLAGGERTAVLAETLQNETTNNNGTEWYYKNQRSMGFAPGGATISQNSADVMDSEAGDATSTQRLSWHTGDGTLESGWRAGANTGLSYNWSRYIYQADTLPSYYPSGPQTNVPEGDLAGWSLCYQGSYGDSSVSLAGIFSRCSGNYLMYAASVNTQQKMDVKLNGVSLLNEVGGNYNTTDIKVFPGSTVNLELYEADGVTPINWNTYRAYVSNCNYNDCELDNPQNDTSPTSWDNGTLTSGTYTIPAGSDYRSIVFFIADDETGDYVPGNFVKINISKMPETHMISDCEQLFSMDTDFGQGSELDTYKLSNDIDCSSVENPDPLSWEYDTFAGLFDGQGYTIRNLTMNNKEGNNFGLFSSVFTAIIKNVTIEDSSITGYNDVGSIVGDADTATLENVHSTADVSGRYDVGGIIGNVYQTTVSDSSATGNITADKNDSTSIGGFAGSIDGESMVTRSFATGNVEGEDSVGGFAGEIYDSTISYSGATGNVSSDTIENGLGTGGFVGRIGGDAHVYESLATGKVEGYTRVGGFAGANGALIENAYARGDVTGTENVGGFAGRCGGDITNAYSTGFIEGGDETGGFLGSDPGCDVTNSYWDVEQSYMEDSAAGTGKTTAEMIQQATFEGWDFNDVWIIDPSTNDSYPSFLKFGEDNDLDGVPSLTEETGPNGGDGNDDGIADKYQENVTSLPNAKNDSYVALETSCGTGTKNKDVSVNSEDESKKDAAYSYAQGLVSFKTQCQDVGGTASVSLYFYGVSSKDGLVLRKFNPVTGSYTTISDPTLTLITIDGQSVLKATYSITDGGALDQDGIADGIITDPVGLGTVVVSVPNTGL
jgi:hypothetical protein